MWPQNSRLNSTATTAFESLTQVLRRFRREILFAKKKTKPKQKAKTSFANTFIAYQQS